jgi:large subunit ribosomal protein L22
VEAVAISKNVHHSATKVRQIADLVRGKPVEEALNLLEFLPRAAAVPMRKTIHSALHNLVNVKGSSVEAEDTFIKEILVDEGRILYRIRPRAQGRAFRIRKRTSHIKVVVSLHEKAKEAAGEAV